MKKISVGVYEHIVKGIKFECIKGSDIYNIYVDTADYGRYKCGTGASLDSCKRMTKDLAEMDYIKKGK